MKSQWLPKLVMLVLLGAVLAGVLLVLDRRTALEDWAQYKAKLAARGRSVQWRDVIPSPPPDAGQNFAATPLLRAVARKGQPPGAFETRLADAGLEPHLGKYADWRAGQPLDVVKLAEGLGIPLEGDEETQLRSASAGILKVLEKIRPELDELREAARRPFAQFEFNHSDPMSADIPNFVVVRKLAQSMSMRASVLLSAHRAEEALADVRVIDRLAEACAHEPSLVSAMIAVAVRALEMETFWEGWSADRWTDRQLEQLQAQFAHVNLIAQVVHGANTELAIFSHLMERASSRDLADEFGAGTGSRWSVRSLQDRFTQLTFRLAPRSWRYKNLVLYGRLLDSTLLDHMNASERRVWPGRLEAASQQLTSALRRSTPSNIFVMNMMPNFSRAIQTAAKNQTALHQALIACALERFRRRHGEYPATLDALVPTFTASIPADVVTGRPLIYRRTNDGRFLLYSVGWNETDDGGRATQSLDWVWPVKAR